MKQSKNLRSRLGGFLPVLTDTTFNALDSQYYATMTRVATKAGSASLFDLVRLERYLLFAHLESQRYYPCITHDINTISVA